MSNVPSAYYQFIIDYAPYLYVIDGNPDLSWGKAALATAFSINFLYEAYYDSQFASKQTEIYNKIVSLADFILTQQNTNPPTYHSVETANAQRNTRKSKPKKYEFKLKRW